MISAVMGWQCAASLRFGGAVPDASLQSFRRTNITLIYRRTTIVVRCSSCSGTKIENTVDGKDVKLGTEKDVTPLFEFSTTATNDPDRRQPGLVTADTDDLNRVDSGVRCSAPSAPVRR